MKKKYNNLPREQIGVVIPMLSLLLAIFPVFRVFTTLLTFIYSEDISSILFTKIELNIYLVDKCRIIQFIILEGRIKGRNIGFRL